jgi:AcrR family transcriptional regulator
MTTRGRPPTISDDALLEAATAVFLEQGVGATTAKIAKKAGISESVLFHRYKTKEKLFLAVLDRKIRVPPIFENLGERVGQGNIAEHLLELGGAIVEEMKAFMPFFVVASMMARASTWKLDELRERMKRPHPTQLRTLRLFAGYLEAEADRGRLRHTDAEIVARVFLGAVFQQVMQQYWTSESEILPLPTHTFLRGLVDLLLNGALPRASSPKAR